MTARALLLIGSCLAGAGCGQVLDIPTDPVLVATGPWRCLGAPSSPAGAAPAATAHVRVSACNFITDCTTSVTGLSAKLCDKRDVGCLSPRLTGVSQVDGEFRFDVPTAGGGFAGYLLVDSPAASCTDAEAFGAVAGQTLCGLAAPQCDLTAPDARCMTKLYAPSMLFFNPPIATDVQDPLALQMFPISGLPSVIAAAGIQLEPGTGSLLIQALDCDGEPAAGVTFEVERFQDQVSPLYVDNGIVSASAGRTDASGVGGFVGVPQGFVTVTGRNAEGTTVGTIGVQASPGLLTYSALTPVPTPTP